MENMIGRRIKERRKELKLTQVQIKDICGISNGNLSDFENGNKAPSANALIALSKVLHVSIDWILTGENYHEDITNEILSGCEHDFLQLFRYLDTNDQEEIIALMELKIKRKDKQRKSSTSQTTADIETA